MNQGLAFRILLPLGLCLAAIIATTGYAMHGVLLFTHNLSISERLAARQQMLLNNLEFDDGKLELEMRLSEDALGDLAEEWSVGLDTGVILWHSAQQLPTECLSRDVIHTHILEDDEHDQHRHNDQDQSQHDKRHIVIRSATDITQETNELWRTDMMLCTGLPVLYLAIMSMVFFIVRREVRPLSKIAASASSINPDQLSHALAFAQSNTYALEIQTLNTALNAMMERMFEGLQRERQFSAAAAHELRTPVAQLITSLEIAKRKERSVSTYQQIIDDALLDSKRLADLIVAMMSLSASHVDETSICTLANLRDVVKDFNITLEHAADTPLDLQISGSCALYAVVLRNLIDNARRYGGDHIRVCLAIKNEHILLSVIDNGPGIPAIDRQRIFQPLVRLDAARTISDEPGGFGLGLAIVSTILKKIGADIVCTENSSGGSTFEINIQTSTMTN